MSTHDYVATLPTIASSDAKNRFAALLERVLRRAEPVVITRNARPTAVMLSVEAYERLIEAVPDPLAALEDDFDALVAKMQTASSTAAVEALFAATPTRLGSAAVRAAKAGH